MLPGTWYTHVNNCSPTRSWIDHYLCTKMVRSAVTSVSIEYNYMGSDNFPMMVTIKLKMFLIPTLYKNTCFKIKWEFTNDDKTETFFELVCGSLPLTGKARLNCSAPFRERNNHKNNLETYLETNSR